MIFEESQFSSVSHLRQPIICIDFNDIVANIQNYKGTNAFNFIKRTNSPNLVHSLANYIISYLAFQFYLLDDTEYELRYSSGVMVMTFLGTGDYLRWYQHLLNTLVIILNGSRKKKN